MLKLAAAIAALSFVLPAAAGGISPAILFQNRCAECHGKDGKSPSPAGRAMGAPSLAAKARDAAEIRAIVANGKGKMPALGTKLSDDQIAAVAGYVTTRL